MGIRNRLAGKTSEDTTETFVRRFAGRSRGWFGELAKADVELYDRVADLERRPEELSSRKLD